MSSKTQLADYVKTLESEISSLKSENKTLQSQNLKMRLDRTNLKEMLFKSLLRERKWYHFF